MKLFSKKPAPAPAVPPLPRQVNPQQDANALAKNETVLNVDLPDVFAFEQDETKSKALHKKTPSAAEQGARKPTRGTVLLVESDDEVCRLVSRLLQHEGFNVAKASCLAEARAMIKDVAVNFLLARRACVPLNLQTEIALRDLQSKTIVRIVDEFSELMLGQVIDYESMSQCSLGLLDLLLSLIEGGNLGARGHSHNVAKYCRLVGQRMGLTRRELDALTLAAYVHDLGSLETRRQIGELVIGKNELLPPSLRPTLDLLANISFPYNVNDLLSATSESRPASDDTPGAVLPPVPAGARILRVVDTYETLRRSNGELQNEDALFDWLRRQPTGTLDPDALEALIHIRKHERTISAMNIFWAAVLLVDPHPEELQLLRLRLENDDYHVLVAKSVEEALHHLRRAHVTVILSEYHLGRNGDGFELLRAVKKDTTLSSIPFVFHSLPDNDLIKEALELGAEDWYAKPHNVEITAMKLARIVARLHENPASSDGVHGNLRDMGIIEMVQILRAGGRSVHIVLEKDAIHAELVMQKGDIISASLGELIGEPAALEILRWTDGHFRIQPLKQAPAANVTTSTDNLLLQTCQQDAKQSNNQTESQPQTRSSATHKGIVT